MANNQITKKQGEAAVKREDRRKAREKHASSQLGTAGSALIGSAAFAFLTTKMPRVASIDSGGKVHTAPIIAALAILGGMGSRQSMIFGAGIGIGSAWVADIVSDQDWAQPSS
jgi:hypothetical protein